MKRKKRGLTCLLIAVICIAAILFSAVMYRYIQINREQQTLDEAYQSQIAQYETIKPSADSDDGGDTWTFSGVAWITVPDTQIDFPVAWCEDNEFYLSHDIDGSYSSFGVPFLDYRNQPDFSDFNSIIYGHHITKGRMFAGLTYFKEQNFFEEHDTISLTLEDGTHEVHILASLVVESTAFTYTTVFLTDAEKLEFLKQIQENALFCREFTPEEMLDKRFLTLSTCSYEFDEARTVVFGWIDPE